MHSIGDVLQNLRPLEAQQEGNKMAVNGASHVQIRETGNSYLALSETYYRQGATIRQAVQAAIEETDKMGRYLWMAVTPDKQEDN